MSEAHERRADAERSESLYADAATPMAAQARVRSTCRGEARDDVVRGGILGSLLSSAERDWLADHWAEAEQCVGTAIGAAREAAASTQARVFEEALLRVHLVVLAIRAVLAHPAPSPPPEAPTTMRGDAVLLGAFAVTRAALTIGTALTTAYGVWVMLQSLLDPLREVLTPPVCNGLAGVGAAACAVLVARTVHGFKLRIEGLLEAGRPLRASIREAMRPQGRRRIAALLLLGVLGFDLLSNITSVAALLLIESDRAAQLVEPRETLQQRIDAYGHALDGLAGDAEAGVSAEIERILQEELDGDSYTGLSGKGKAYWSKAYALRADRLARTRLEALATKGVSGARELLETLEAFQQGHGEPHLARRVGAILTTAEREARQALDAAQADLDAVGPSVSLDEAQRRFNAITGSVWQGRGHLDHVEEALEKAKVAVEAETDRADGVLREIAEIVGRVAGVEVAAAAVESLRVELPEVDGEAIELPGLHHRGAIELLRYAHARLGLAPTVAVVLVSVGGSLLASYGEFVFLLFGLGRIHARDRRHRRAVACWLESEREAFASNLHGVFSGPPGRVISDAAPTREVVEQVLVEAFQEAEDLRDAAHGGLLRRSLTTTAARQATQSLEAWAQVAGSLDAVVWLTRVMYGRAAGLDSLEGGRPGRSLTVGHVPRPGLAELDAALSREAARREEKALGGELGALADQVASWSPEDPEAAADLEAQLREIQARVAVLPQGASSTRLAEKVVDLHARLRARARAGRADLDPAACRWLALKHEVTRLEQARREDPDRAALLAVGLERALAGMGGGREHERLQARLQACATAITEDQEARRRRAADEQAAARRARETRRADVRSKVEGWAARRRVATEERRGLVLRHLFQDLGLLAPDETSELALYRAAFALRELLDPEDPTFELVKDDLHRETA